MQILYHNGPVVWSSLHSCTERILHELVMDSVTAFYEWVEKRNKAAIKIISRSFTGKLWESVRLT